MMKLISASVAVTFVVGLALLIDAQSQVPTARPPEPEYSYRVFAAGRIEGRTPEMELRTELAGRVTALLVSENQIVEEGQLLLRLDDRQCQHELAMAEAELRLAEAQKLRLINGASREERLEADALYRAGIAAVQREDLKWQRIVKLRDARAIAEQEADDQSSLLQVLRAQADAAKARADLTELPARHDDLQIADARVGAARARKDLALTQLDRTLLRAPCRGRILAIHVEQGELTGPSAVEPAVVMANTDGYQVRAFVEELDAPRVAVGMTARITADGFGSRSIPGTVKRLSPRMSRKVAYSDRPAERLDTKVREVWIDVDADCELVIGLPVDVIIETALSKSEPSPLQTASEGIPDAGN